MRSGQEAARRFHEEPERSSDFLCLPDLEDFLFCLPESRNLWKQQIENIHLISSSKHDLPGSFEDLSRPASHSLSNTRKKIREKNETKKE